MKMPDVPSPVEKALFTFVEIILAVVLAVPTPVKETAHLYQPFPNDVIDPTYPELWVPIVPFVRLNHTPPAAPNGNMEIHPHSLALANTE
jgi:hypothetical protein